MTESALALVIEPQELEQHLGDDKLLIVDLCKPEVYAQVHVPGAVHLDYAELNAKVPPAVGALPDEGQLSRVCSGIGLTPDKHVVAYDDEGGGRASRLLWTLDVIGHRRYSLLNGGLHAWAHENHPLESVPVHPTPSDYRAQIQDDAPTVDRDYIRTHLDDDNVVLLDARSAAEYTGRDVRAQRGGHIPGAIHFDWLEAMDRSRNLRLKSAEELMNLLQQRGLPADRDKEVITYCQTHHRSAHTFVMLRWLGYRNAKGYPGAWSDWGNQPDTPVE